MAEEFTSNWWEHLYNHTSKKIDKHQEAVASKPKPVEVEVKSADEQRKAYFYSRFQKGSKLVDGQNIEVPKSEKKSIVKNEEDDYDKKGKKM